MPAPAKPDRPHRLREHVHLLEVHEAVEARLVALVRECHVLQQQRHEGYDRRLELPDAHPVSPVVSARIDQRLEFRVELPEFRGELLPRQRQPRNRHVAQTHHYSAESVQVLVFLAAGIEKRSVRGCSVVGVVSEYTMRQV